MSQLHERGVPHSHLGKVAHGGLRINISDETFRWPVAELYDDWWNAIRYAIESDTAERIPSL